MKIYLSSFYWFWHPPSYTMSVNLTRSWLNLFVFTKRYLDQLRKSSFVSNSSKVLCTPRVCIGKMIADFIIETKEKQRRQNFYFLSTFLYIDWHKKTSSAQAFLLRHLVLQTYKLILDIFWVWYHILNCRPIIIIGLSFFLPFVKYTTF